MLAWSLIRVLLVQDGKRACDLRVLSSLKGRGFSAQTPRQLDACGFILASVGVCSAVIEERRSHTLALTCRALTDTRCLISQSRRAYRWV